MQNKGLIKFQEWKKKADEDFLSACVLIENQGAPSTITFLSQQIAEKYLKGFVVLHGKSFEKTHKLDELVMACENIDASFKELIDEVAQLNDYYTEARYPLNTREDIFMKEAEEALKKATSIRDFVLSKIKIS
ncbi:MAG: HEPN domain-containing protein [bacterium]|nr:HEPN domain-containing protein [bacterium]